MLRAAVTREPEGMWRLSSGTATVVGLADSRLLVAPTTAYVMLGSRCRGDCAFCAQARTASSRDDKLSRVVWPVYDAEDAAGAVAESFARGDVGRACFQMTTFPGHVEAAIEAVGALCATTEMPICVSIAPRDLVDIERLLDAGAERVTMALDAASAAVYAKVKSGRWERTLDLLTTAGAAFPGHIGTHLIVGLGENDRELIECFQQLYDLGITIGLFAFTPVKGTSLEDCAPPPLARYRRMQLLRWLIERGLTNAAACAYDSDGSLEGLELGRATLEGLLSDPVNSPFRTAGCADCNRPFYNERPTGPMYNYAEPLSKDQVVTERAAVLESLTLSS